MIRKRKPFTRIPGQGEKLFIQLFNLQFSNTYLLRENYSRRPGCRRSTIIFNARLRSRNRSTNLSGLKQIQRTLPCPPAKCTYVNNIIIMYNLIFSDVCIISPIEVIRCFILMSVQIQG